MDEKVGRDKENTNSKNGYSISNWIPIFTRYWNEVAKDRQNEKKIKIKDL